MNRKVWAVIGAAVLALALLKIVLTVLSGTAGDVTSQAQSTSMYEDAPHTSGDRGNFVLGVRNDAGSALATDGDYMPLTMDSSGRLWIAPVVVSSITTGTIQVDDGGNVLSVDDGAGSLTVDASELVTIAGAVTGSEMQVDIVADGAGLATLASINRVISDTADIEIAVEAISATVATSANQLADGHNVTIDNAAAGAAVNIQDGGNTITVDGTVAAGAGEAHVGEVGTNSDVISVTLSLDTSQYASGDVLAATQEIPNAMRVLAGTGIWYSLVVQDLDDQAGALDVVLLDANCSIGTENAAVSIADSCADNILCVVEVISADYVDMVNSQVALKSPDCLAEATAGIDELWFGVVSRDTITYTASGIVLQFGLLRD